LRSVLSMSDRPRTPRSGVPHKDYTGRKTSPGYAIPDFVEPEATGNYEGEELARIRARRPTSERLRRLEEKHDALSETVIDLRVGIGTMSGKLDTVLTHVTATHREQQVTERTRISSRAKIIVGVVGAVCAAIGAAITGLL
jgi:hypothetical protein